MYTAAEHERSSLEVGVTVVELSQSPNGESPLTPEEIDAFRQHMQQIRDWLLVGISRVESQSAKTARARISVASTEVDDGAWEQAVTQRTVANKRLLLNEIMQAFERIREGTYGRCVDDNSCLSRSLLDEVPWAKYCPSCARRHT